MDAAHSTDTLLILFSSFHFGVEWPQNSNFYLALYIRSLSVSFFFHRRRLTYPAPSRSIIQVERYYITPL